VDGSLDLLVTIYMGLIEISHVELLTMSSPQDSRKRPQNDHDDHYDDEDDDDDKLQSQIWTYSVWAAAVALFYMGKWKIGLCFVVIGVLYMGLFGSMLITKRSLDEQDRLRIQYNIWSADDVVQDLKRRLNDRVNDSAVNDATAPDSSHPHPPKVVSLPSSTSSSSSCNHRTIALVALSALSKKYQQWKQQDRPAAISKIDDHPTTASVTGDEANGVDKHRDQDDATIVCACQEAAYACLTAATSIVQNDDDVVAESFALLALVAKHATVRQRHVQQADTYGLNIVIESMTRALNRARDYHDASSELRGAELQRKACLLLGAWSDGPVGVDSDTLSRLVVAEGGLQAILSAIAWFRLHEGVANWGLWAVFITCYENQRHKVALLQLDGLSVVLNAMKCHGSNIDVTRHATAILFDLLREPDGKTNNSTDTDSDENRPLDVARVRKLALAAGLHDRLLHALQHLTSPNCKDIVLMAREMLVGTGYQGDLPDVGPLA
jgi:hypothetical protein